jgi:hypothetical protein
VGGKSEGYSTSLMQKNINLAVEIIGLY